MSFQICMTFFSVWNTKEDAKEEKIFFTSVDTHVSHLKPRCSKESTEFWIIICCRLAVTALYKQSWKFVPPGGSGGALSCDLPAKIPVSVVSGKSCLHWKVSVRVDLRGKRGQSSTLDSDVMRVTAPLYWTHTHFLIYFSFHNFLSLIVQVSVGIETSVAAD